MTQNPLSKRFTALSLLRYALPTIIMMAFMSLYTMVDGMFISRLINTTALSATNIVYPIVNVVIAVGIMLATGASAVVASQMGEEKEEEARQNFSFIVVVGIIVGILITVSGIIFLNPLLRFLGADEAVWQYCYDYGFTMLLFTPCSILQMLFQYFFVTAGRPSLGLIVIVLGGVANVVLDYIFMGPLDMGVFGAALATGIGYSIPAGFGLWYFFKHRNGSLYFVKPKLRGRVLLKSCTNGSSEMVTNLSIAVITLMFNLIMMRLVGEDGVAAITIVLYAEFLLISIFLGYSSGIAPIISYQYGSGDSEGLRQVFRVSIIFLLISSFGMFVAAILLRDMVVGIFAPESSPVRELASYGFFLYSFAYIFKGINIFASAFFTALNNGLVSAILSFLRTFLFIAVALIFLPRVWGLEGVWLAVPLAEFLAIAFSVGLLFFMRKVYHYA